MKRRSQKQVRYITLLTVHVASAASLIDMMRYDMCYPASEDESRKIWSLIGTEQCGNPNDPKNHIVRLLRVAMVDKDATAERWRSFACTVLDERRTNEVPFSDADAFRKLAVIRGKPRGAP